MDKQQLVDFLGECQKVYNNHEELRSHVGIEISRLSIAINLSIGESILKEVINEYKGIFSVAKYLGKVEF